MTIWRTTYVSDRCTRILHLLRRSEGKPMGWKQSIGNAAMRVAVSRWRGLAKGDRDQVLGVALPFVKLKPELDYQKAPSQFRMKVMVIMMVERRVLMRMRLHHSPSGHVFTFFFRHFTCPISRPQTVRYRVRTDIHVVEYVVVLRPSLNLNIIYCALRLTSSLFALHLRIALVSIVSSLSNLFAQSTIVL